MAKEEGLEYLKSLYATALRGTGLSDYLRNAKLSLFNTFWVYAFVVVVMPLISLSHFYTGFFDTGSIGNRFQAIGLALNQLEIAVKSIYLLQAINRFKLLVLDFDNFFSVKHGGNRALTYLKVEANKIRSLQNSYQIVGVFTFFSFAMVPIAASPSAYLYNQYSEGVTKLLPSKYPFSVAYFPMAQIVYVFETCSVCIGLTHFIGINLFYVTVVKLLCLMLRLLGDSLSSHSPIEIKEFVQDHQKLLRVCKEVRDLLSPILALQLLVSALTICFAIFEITMVNETSKGGGEQAILYIRKTCYTIIIFIQLLLYCWLSTELEEATSSVRDGVYNGPWYLKNGADYKEIIIISARSLRPVRLTALFMVNLHLGTSIEVLRVAYSYYTMLKQMNH